MNSSLEALLVTTEIRLGRLFVPIAESAYQVRDVKRAHEAKDRGEAAYFRASHLIPLLADVDRSAIVRELDALRSALNRLFQQLAICAEHEASGTLSGLSEMPDPLRN